MRFPTTFNSFYAVITLFAGVLTSWSGLLEANKSLTGISGVLVGSIVVGIVLFFCGRYASPEIRQALAVLVLIYDFMFAAFALVETARFIWRDRFAIFIGTPLGLTTSSVALLAYLSLVIASLRFTNKWKPGKE